MENFTNALRQVFTAIEGLEQGEKSVRPSEAATVNDAGSLDISKLTPLFTQFAVLLEEDDMEAVGYLATLKEYLKGLNVEQELQEIEENIDQYNFEQALRVLETIAQQLEISGVPNS